MKTQVALRLDEDLLGLAKQEADRQNRSLANLVELVLAEFLMSASGDVPILTLADERLADAVALDDEGGIDDQESERLRHLIAVTGQEGQA